MYPPIFRPAPEALQRRDRRGALRIAVLINEVGRVDVDSELVNAKQVRCAPPTTDAQPAKRS